MSPPPYNDCASEMSDCSSMEEGRETSNRRGNTIITIRQDRKARRVESNNRERRRMHELNHAFQVGIFDCLKNIHIYREEIDFIWGRVASR